MFTWGSKYLFGVCVAAWLGALVYGLVSGGDIVGVLSMGYKGGVGEHTGYAILLAASFSALFLGVVGVITRDGDAEELSSRAGADHALAVKPPVGLSIAGPLAAFGIACLALGLSVSRLFLYLGLAVLAVVGLEWTVQAWSERATGDDEVNDVIRRRIIGPFEVPMLSALGVVVVAIGLSRVMLAVSKVEAVIVVSIVAVFIFGSAVFIAKARAPRAVISALVTLGALMILGGGIVGAVAGEREFHEHEDDHGEEHSDDHSEDGAGE
ncbi:MAG: hypothetical protein AAGA93_13640 [Actinomycetota bacterium]